MAKIHFAVLMNGAKKASAWRGDVGSLAMDLAWAEQNGLPALALIIEDDKVVATVATTHVNGEALRAALVDVI